MTEALVPLPVILPLLGTGATLMLHRWPRAQRAVSTVVLLAVVVVSALLLRFRYSDELDRVFSVEQLPLVPQLLFWLGFMNVILAVFNLLPIPPLDGSAMVERVLPNDWWPTWLKFRQYGFGILLLLVFVVPGALDKVFDPALRQWVKLL